MKIYLLNIAQSIQVFIYTHYRSEQLYIMNDNNRTINLDFICFKLE